MTEGAMQEERRVLIAKEMSLQVEATNLRLRIRDIELELQKTCTHPNKQEEYAGVFCPDCGWSVEIDDP